MRLRKATMEDELFLFDLRNDPEVLRWSWNHQAINAHGHRQWLEKALFFNDPEIYIGIEGNTKVGSVRVKDNGEEQVVSIAVPSRQRGKGYGTKMLAALKDGPYTAYIHPDNVASKRIFEKAGYTLKWKAEKK